MSHAESPQELLPECHANARPSLWKRKAADRRFPDHQCLPGRGSGEGAAVSLKLRYMVVKGRLCFRAGPCHQPLSPQLLQRGPPLRGCRELPKAQPPSRVFHCHASG